MSYRVKNQQQPTAPMLNQQPTPGYQPNGGNYPPNPSTPPYQQQPTAPMLNQQPTGASNYPQINPAIPPPYQQHPTAPMMNQQQQPNQSPPVHHSPSMYPSATMPTPQHYSAPPPTQQLQHSPQMMPNGGISQIQPPSTQQPSTWAAPNHSNQRPQVPQSSWQGGAPKAQFFADMKIGLTRDYILIIDRSGSMAGSRWQQARQGVAMLAPEICKCDPDGANVYFFSSYGKISKYQNIRDGYTVMQLFDQESPYGTTDLAEVLSAALNDHFNPQRRVPGYNPGHGPTTILVVTDGEPDDKGEVMNLLIHAANCLERDEELSISFIQVGEDDKAMQFLKELDDGLVHRGARFDIVDSISCDKMRGIGFEKLIWNSIND